ncbi:uncharacterized protein LOC110908175 [Helianthus annuus]|uniref:uncharacterized protein LOC110908175 n=1 Tax=Helianthus annuus TaxID=4232 RepID=UPI000B8EFC02|nr:uncharacterized protein LOC110908175 [Helianthus annuus]
MCEPVEVNEPMTDEEQLVWMYMLEIDKEKNAADKKKSPKKELPKTKSKGVYIIDDEQEQMEAKIAEANMNAEGSEVHTSFFKEIFETGYGLQSKAYLMTHMIPGKQVYGNTIDCWAAVLNYQERYKPERLDVYFATHRQLFRGC